MAIGIFVLHHGWAVMFLRPCCLIYHLKNAVLCDKRTVLSGSSHRIICKSWQMHYHRTKLECKMRTRWARKPATLWAGFQFGGSWSGFDYSAKWHSTYPCQIFFRRQAMTNRNRQQKWVPKNRVLNQIRHIIQRLGRQPNINIPIAHHIQNFMARTGENFKFTILHPSSQKAHKFWCYVTVEIFQ